MHSISWKLFTKHDSRNTKVSIKKDQFFGLLCCSTRENLSNRVPISYYCRTNVEEARVISVDAVVTVFAGRLGLQCRRYKLVTLKLQFTTPVQVLSPKHSNAKCFVRAPDVVRLGWCFIRDLVDRHLEEDNSG